MFARALLLVLLATAPLARGAPPPEAVLVTFSDVHSAIDRLPQLVATVDAAFAAAPDVPHAILIDGDLFEGGNAVAKRSDGAVEFAFLRALSRRAPTVLTIGNHEPEFFDLAETVRRIEATGVTVLSANARDRAGRPFASATTRLKLRAGEAVVVGLTTDRLTTFRAAVRPEIDVADPVAWAGTHLQSVLAEAPLHIVLSHAGLAADRRILPLVPDGTLFIGGHDHLRLVHREGRTVYLQSGSWASHVSVITLRRDPNGDPEWSVEQVPVAADSPGDPEVAGVLRHVEAVDMTPAERAVVARTSEALAPSDAARWATGAAGRAAHADVAVIGATTFGAGLPKGDVTRHAFDDCVRFDGPLFAGEISGQALQRLVAHTRSDVPFAERSGENLVIVAPEKIDPHARYRLVTTDWIARNPRPYLGHDAPALTEVTGLRLKAAVLSALNAP